MIYLDYSANTPTDPRVAEVYVKTALAFPGNPNSEHSAGRASHEKMQDALKTIAELLHVCPEELIPTSGASEAANLAVKGTARISRHTGRHIISTALEHSSVSGALTALKDQGWEVDLCEIGEDGRIDLTILRDLLRKDTVLVSVSAVDSELGTIQPVREIRELLQAFPDCRLHVDATQAVGKLPFEDGDCSPASLAAVFRAADLVSFAPHKFYGLPGSGFLWMRKGTVVEPLIHGGSSTTVYRSGTPDVPAAAAAAEALALACLEEEARLSSVRQWNSRLRNFFKSYRSVSVNSPADAVLHILNLSVAGVKADDFRAALDERGICVSVKSACSVKGTPSRAVFAVTHDRRRAQSSWRISLSHLTSEEDLCGFEEAFDACMKQFGCT